MQFTLQGSFVWVDWIPATQCSTCNFLFPDPQACFFPSWVLHPSNGFSFADHLPSFLLSLNVLIFSFSFPSFVRSACFSLNKHISVEIIQMVSKPPRRPSVSCKPGNANWHFENKHQLDLCLRLAQVWSVHGPQHCLIPPPYFFVSGPCSCFDTIMRGLTRWYVHSNSRSRSSTKLISSSIFLVLSNACQKNWISWILKYL